MLVFRLLPAVFALAACATGGKPQGVAFVPETVNAIRLRVSADGPGGMLSPPRLEQLTAQVGRNLSSWGYPVDAASDPGSRPYSHLMEAQVGEVTRKKTPPGFSFSFGNSDPQAIEFQTADVVPVTCRLSSRQSPREAVKLSGDFSVGMALGGTLRSDGRSPPVAFLVDRITTACLNLLRELKVPKAVTSKADATPAWIPQVRVEVKKKAGEDAEASPEPAPASEDAAPNPDDEAPAAEAAGAAPTESPVKTETRAKGSDSRKQLIIHNRGNPVILEFGYERR